MVSRFTPNQVTFAPAGDFSPGARGNRVGASDLCAGRSVGRRSRRRPPASYRSLPASRLEAETAGGFVDLEVRHLRLVVAVAEHGTLTAAAEGLHLTQSALSHQLKDIEDRLKAPLFLRRNHRMIPTAAGQHLLDTSLSVLAELERAETALRDLGRTKQGLLRVATECYTCYHWLPPVLQQFTARCPGVDVRIDVDATSRPLAVLLAGKLDLALMLSPVRDRRVAATPLFRDELLVVGAGQAPLREPSVRAPVAAG